MTYTETPALDSTAVAVCLDCHLAAAGYSAEETGSTPDREPWALWDGEPGMAVAEDVEGYFSWQGCDGCGSTLGGDRFDYTWLR